jgi:hypothetical protein
MKKIALNINDLFANDEVCYGAACVLKNCVGEVVIVDKKSLDEKAVVLSTDENSARGIVEILRMWYPLLRAYESTPRGTWKKIR